MITNEQKLLATEELYTTLKDLVRCIRDFQLGDYSPLMDEIFEAEYALRLYETGSGELPD